MAIVIPACRSQVGPASKEVKTVAEAEAVLAKPEVVVFGFGDQPAHAKAAAKLRESVLFAHTTSEEVIEAFECSELTIPEENYL